MISYSAARTLVRMLCRQPLFAKHFLSKANYRFAFLHTSRHLWNGHPIEIKMPALSPTMTEGTIVKWFKKEGDTVSPGDVLCEIQTDKAIVALETEEEGVLEKILVPEDTKNIQLGEIIAIIMGEGSSEIVESSATPATKTQDIDKKRDTEKHTADPTRLTGPSVKKLLEEYKITFSKIPCSGPHHNMLKGDVLSYIKNHDLKQVKSTMEKPKHQKPSSLHPLSKSIDIPITSTDVATANQMIQSKTTIPHGYMRADCKIDKVLDYQKKFQKDGIAISLNDFVVKSAVTALKKVPRMSVIRHNGQLKSVETINILLTDFTDGGYTTSIIKRADKLNVELISEHIKSSQITGDSNKTIELTSGIFKISNLSIFGISEYSEIISPTDVAAMAVGGVRYVFEQEKPVKKMMITLSFDNSVITDNEAGEFLETFKQCLENPLNIMCMS